MSSTAPHSLTPQCDLSAPTPSLSLTPSNLFISHLNAVLHPSIHLDSRDVDPEAGAVPLVLGVGVEGVAILLCYGLVTVSEGMMIKKKNNLRLYRSVM